MQTIISNLTSPLVELTNFFVKFYQILFNFFAYEYAPMLTLPLSQIPLWSLMLSLVLIVEMYALIRTVNRVIRNFDFYLARTFRFVFEPIGILVRDVKKALGRTKLASAFVKR